MRRFICCFAVVVIASSFALGQTYKVLYNFQDNPDGAVPEGALVLDSSGNLYGTTIYGGVSSTCAGGGCGVVFELSPNSDGTWSESILHSFCEGGTGFNCSDGAYPYGALIRDSRGNLYGYTHAGGLCVSNGCGGVYELSPPSMQGGPWAFNVLYNFCSDSNCVDGMNPVGSLSFDGKGNLFGATGSGGTNEVGIVFELVPGSSGWTETVIYNFCSVEPYCVDGEDPTSGVTFDKAGNFYGTTLYGGDSQAIGAGIIYKFSPSGNGQWTETIVAALPPTKLGPKSPSSVVLDPAGNIYTVFATGNDGQAAGGVGVLNGNGKFRAFLFDGTDGKYPLPNPVIDVHNHVLYGTTSGGTFGPGNVYEIDGSGNESVVYQFCPSDCTTGYEPLGGLVEDKSGNLYGTTSSGGTGGYGFGVVFEITP